MTSAAGDDAIDGPKVDRDGNVYVSGPCGCLTAQSGLYRMRLNVAGAGPFAVPSN